jgi:hypothetical protein
VDGTASTGPTLTYDVLTRVVAWSACLALLAPAVALLLFGAAASDAWFLRHVLLPALNPPPPPWTLLALRSVAVVLGLLLAVGAAAAGRWAKPDAMARVALAIALAVCASEIALRALPVPLTRMGARGLEVSLGAPDARTGWAFTPRRTVDLPGSGRGRIVRYGIDAHGDRAPSAEWLEDPQASTILIAGESIAAGHGLPWPETFAARLGELMGVQVVDVAEGGYGNDQAHLRTVDALARLQRPLAVVTTVLPVQLYRNLHDDRPHLVLRDGALILEPPTSSHLELRQLFANDLPYLSESSLQKSLTLTRAILHSTAAVARAKGAQPLFVFLSSGPPRDLDAHPEAFIVRALLDDLPYILVDTDPARMLPGDFGHPDAEGARQIAVAIADALARTHS